MTQLLRGLKNLSQHSRGPLLEMNGLTAAILRVALSRDPAVFLQTIQNARERRLLNPDAGSDFFLRELVASAGEMRQGRPLTHAQTEWPETLVELRPPRTGGCGQEEANALNVRIQHEIVSMLTIAPLSTLTVSHRRLASRASLLCRGSL